MFHFGTTKLAKNYHICKRNNLKINTLCDFIFLQATFVHIRVRRAVRSENDAIQQSHIKSCESVLNLLGYAVVLVRRTHISRGVVVYEDYAGGQRVDCILGYNPNIDYGRGQSTLSYLSPANDAESLIEQYDKRAFVDSDVIMVELLGELYRLGRGFALY